MPCAGTFRAGAGLRRTSITRRILTPRVAELLTETERPADVRGHAAWVRISHWILTTSVLTVAVTGFVILMAHPRLYWGEAGNDLTPALLELPISRNFQHGGWEHDIRTYDIFNQNGWGRSLHFLAAWFLLISGGVYLIAGSV